MADSTQSDESDPVAHRRADWLRLIGGDAKLDALVRRHRERHRSYHTLDHVIAVVDHVGELGATEPISDLGSVTAAAWYHDAIYEPRSPANERASARLARRDLTELGWSGPRSDAVATMIEGTAHHRDPADIDAAVLFDADLAILGASSKTYGQYVANVRQEYSHVDDDAWRSGRADVLRAFLERDRIYATASGFDRWELAARRNLNAELEDLRN